MKFRSKETIEAFQLTESRALKHFLDEELLPFGVGLSGSYNKEKGKVYRAFTRDFLDEGCAELGDWIIRFGGGNRLQKMSNKEFKAAFESIT